jgi:hypothetical protein
MRLYEVTNQLRNIAKEAVVFLYVERCKEAYAIGDLCLLAVYYPVY